ncbi:glycoside hydrolase family 16 protein [Agrococcus terreus]|uniref:glycoside hydrolase family 16 protein n=1 Tax=Agrococcus terreus TaxID=574649 RepID=UPI00384AD18C
MALPADIAQGFVVGRYALAVTDGDDADRRPDAARLTGSVLFQRIVPTVVSTAEEPTTVVTQSVLATLQNGTLVDSTGAEGVWLVAGDYAVTFRMQPGVTLDPQRIAVTAEHTEAAPLDLSLERPIEPAPEGQWQMTERAYLETLEARDEAVAAAELATDGDGLPGDLRWCRLGWEYRTNAGAPHFNGLWASETGAWVDDQDRLHLKLQSIGGQMHAAELLSTRVGWGYGKYRWVVETPMEDKHTSVVLGMFTYDGTLPPSQNEIDIEASGWSYGPQSWSHTYWRPGVGAEPANRSVGMDFYTADQPATTTHEFEWTPGKIVWRSWHGEDTTKAPDRVSVAVHGEAYSKTLFNGVSYSGIHNVPVPADERVLMNLWVVDDNPATDPETVPETEVVIKSFGFTPLSELSYVDTAATTTVQVPCTYGGSTAYITAEKDANGFVRLYGELSHPSATPAQSNAVIATLPVGYRPVSAVRTEVGVWDNGSQSMTVSLTAGYAPTNPGAVSLRTGPWPQYTVLSFTGITFKAL